MEVTNEESYPIEIEVDGCTVTLQPGQTLRINERINERDTRRAESVDERDGREDVHWNQRNGSYHPPTEG